MRTVLVVSAIAILSMNCAPAALDGFESDGGNQNNANNTNNDVDGGGDSANNMNNAGAPGPLMIAVGEHFGPNCGTLTCHGQGSSNTLTVGANNQNATPSEVFAALSAAVTTADGEPLITPMDPAMSNVITRMELPSEDPKTMPVGAGSDAAAIMIYTDWINAGARITD